MAWRQVRRTRYGQDMECTECGLTAHFEHGEGIFECDHVEEQETFDDLGDYEDEIEDQEWGNA